MLCFSQKVLYHGECHVGAVGRQCRNEREKPLKPMEAQRQAAVRVGPFTVQAVADEQAQKRTLQRLFREGYQAQETAHFVLCHKPDI